MDFEYALTRYAEATKLHNTCKTALDDQLAPHKKKMDEIKKSVIGTVEARAKEAKAEAYDAVRRVAFSVYNRENANAPFAGQRYAEENIGYVDVTPNADAEVTDLAALLADPVARRCIVSVKIDPKVACALASSGELPGIRLSHKARVSVKAYLDAQKETNDGQESD